jgi:hypothetical protein
MFCPNCSAALDDQEHSKLCWNCGAVFGEGSAWKPTAAPVGEFRKFTPPRQKKRTDTVAPAGPMNPFAEVLLRLFLGGILWVVLGVLAALSVMPYGGRSGFVTLFMLSTWGLLAWVFFPLLRLFTSSRKEERDAS